MAGVKGRSGRRPLHANIHEAQKLLANNAPIAVRNILQSIKEGNGDKDCIENSKWLLQLVIPKPTQPIDLGGDALVNSLVQLAKSAAMETPPADTPADAMSAAHTGIIAGSRKRPDMVIED